MIFHGFIEVNSGTTRNIKSCNPHGTKKVSFGNGCRDNFKYFVYLMIIEHLENLEEYL